MKHKDFKKHVNSRQHKDDDNVAIPVQRAHPTMGPQPCSQVKGVYDGFDWDSGTIFIYPEEELLVMDEETKKMLALARKVFDAYYTDAQGIKGSFSRILKGHLKDNWPEFVERTNKAGKEMQEASKKARERNKKLAKESSQKGFMLLPKRKSK